MNGNEHEKAVSVRLSIRDRSDNEIINMFLSRNEAAIKETDRQYGQYLKRIAKNILFDEEDSLECVNDAYLSLWNHIPPDKPRCFKAYIAEVVRNIAISRHRSMAGKRHIPSEYLSSLHELEDYLQSDKTAADEVSDIELKNVINGFVKALPRRQRYIFVCKYYYFDTIPNIAKVLNVSESTVSKEIAVIKQKLKETLIREGYYEC